MTDMIAYRNVIPLISPADVSTTAQTTAYIDLRNAQKACFMVFLGTITSSTATDVEALTIECATAEGGTEAAIGYSYRLSGAVGTNTWGAITTVGTTGLEIGLTDDDKMICVEVDPDVLAANDYRYARLKLTDTDDMNAFEVAVWAEIWPRYKQTTHISATASASA
jgi:hypothetical protein